MLPREFKPLFTQLPGEVHKSTFDRLAEITSQTGKNLGIVMRPSQMKHRNEYVNYRAKTSTIDDGDHHNGRSTTLSQQSRRTSLAPLKTIQQQTPSQEYTYDGKRKRKRFNENLDKETIEAVKQAQQTTLQRLTTARLEELETAVGVSEKSQKSGISRSSRSTAILRAIIRKATQKKDGEKSETPTEYK